MPVYLLMAHFALCGTAVGLDECLGFLHCSGSHHVIQPRALCVICLDEVWPMAKKIVLFVAVVLVPGGF